MEGAKVRTADVEVTNRCNALCHFCPRDRMPALGRMSEDTFRKVLERLTEHPHPVWVSFCGFGEPLMHPHIESFVRRTCEAGLPAGITTNASLLSSERTEALLDAGLSKLILSISDLGEDYEEVYNLDYSRTATNIDHFLSENARRNQPCEVWISLVKHDINQDKLDFYQRHWIAKGVKNFFVTPEINRGGALERGYQFMATDAYTKEAEALIAEQESRILCMQPFHSISIGWEGRYLLCCQDWEKRLPLGHVSEDSVLDIDRVKQEQLMAGNPVCRDCSVNPVNALREKMIEVAAGEADAGAVDRTLEGIKQKAKNYQHLLDLPEYY